MAFKKQRRVACESLERRQLLASDVLLDVVATEAVAETSTRTALPVPHTGDWCVTQPPMANSGHVLAARNFWPGVSSFLPGFNLLAESNGIVAAVRNDQLNVGTRADAPAATVHLFERTDSGELVEAGEIELDFVPQKLLFSDHQLLILGEKRETVGAITGEDDGLVRWMVFPEHFEQKTVTTVMAVSRDNLDSRQRFTIDGALEEFATDGDRLFVSTRESNAYFILIYPPPRMVYQVDVFDISGEETSPLAVGKTFAPITDSMIVDDDLLVIEPREADSNVIDTLSTIRPASNEIQYGPTVVTFPRQMLTRYRISGDGLERIASLDLDFSHVTAFEVADDGKTAVAVGSTQSRHTDQAMIATNLSPVTVDLIDLEEDQPKLFQSVEVPSAGVIGNAEIGRDEVVFPGSPNSLVIVSTDQSIDVDAEGRVSRIMLTDEPGSPAGIVTQILELSGGKYLVATVAPESVEDSEPDAGFAPVLRGFRHVLRTLSIDEQAIVSSTATDASVVIAFEESEAEPRALHFHPILLQPTSPVLSAGRITETGQFEAFADIDLADALEIDVNADRLLVRQYDRIVEYPWDDVENPTETLLGDPLPPPVAVDDIIERNAEGDNRYINVLANDQFVTNRFLSPPRIVELIDAPEGVEIAADGGFLRLTEEFLDEDGTYEFRYVISQGAESSVAEVSLKLFRYTDSQVADAVERIIAKAAEDLEREASELVVGGERRFTSVVMPEKFAAGIVNPLGGQYGVIVDIVVEGQIIRYASNFGDDVARLVGRDLETVMRIGMSLVDREGNPIDGLGVGDEFFVEVSTKDLRRFGFGVFAVAFDLPIPTNKLELTGEIELLGKFDNFGSWETDRGIDEFRAIDVVIPHPGNDLQPVVRFGMRALTGGEVSLQLNPAESLGAELLIRGIDELVSPLEVEFGSLAFEIDGIEPTDTDGNGEVTPTDALRVINFIGRHGSLSVDELPRLADGAEGEPFEFDLDAMRRLDTSADGMITARDALLVINDLERKFTQRLGDAEAVTTLSNLDADVDDSEDLDSDLETETSTLF